MKTKVLVSKVAGVTFEGRQEYIGLMVGNEVAMLKPEPDNKYDPNAIAVWVALPPYVEPNPAKIGYIPREIAAEIAPFLDGENLICSVREIVGGFTRYDGEIATLGVVLEIEYPVGEDGS